jgi:hypothetical protein
MQKSGRRIEEFQTRTPGTSLGGTKGASHCFERERKNHENVLLDVPQSVEQYRVSPMIFLVLLVLDPWTLHVPLT